MEIEKWLSSQGDARSPLGQTLDFTMLPKSLQLYIKTVAEDLGQMFDDLEVLEDCYSVGRMSRVVANQLVATVNSRSSRRKNGSKWSVIFVDRTLDLFNGTLFKHDSAAELIYNHLDALFEDSNDINIPLHKLFNKSENEFIINGCLSDSLPSISILDLVSKDPVTLSDEILETLSDKLQINPDTLESRNLDNILRETDTFSKYDNFFQFQILAAIHASNLRLEQTSAKDLSSFEQSLFWTALEDSVSVPQLANSVISSCAEEKVSAVFITLLLVHLYTLFGSKADDSSDFEEIEMAKLHDLLYKKIAPNKDIFSKSCRTDNEIHDKVDDILRRAKSLAKERSSMYQLASVFDERTATYKSILQRILYLTFESQDDIPDIEYRSGGLRDLLKTGLGLFTRAVTKPRPSGTVLLYVIGGVTLQEVDWIERYRSQTNRDVYLAGNCVLSHQKLLHKLFVADNAFGV